MESTVANMNESLTEDQDGIVTMVDVLKEESEREADANAVLGGADDQKCTYSEGYLPRQPLYACRTCSKDKSAGVCLACSFMCHEGHDLIELYTKRNFRCDCGNSLFAGAKCLLDNVKDAMNENNAYNKNFSGLYCTCSRPYPDPDDQVEDIMMQCVVCEDWFHSRHLEEPHGEAEGELTCHLCVAKLPFLWNYVGDSDGSSGDAACKIASPAPPAATATAVFWPAGWRKNLCQCANCKEMYIQLNVNFLTDEADSVVYYETQNQQQAGESRYEKGLRALSNLGHVQQVEAILGYNDMKSALMQHLQKFSENNQVVGEKDIKDFFEEFEAKRRRRVGPNAAQPPPSCR